VSEQYETQPLSTADMVAPARPREAQEPSTMAAGTPEPAEATRHLEPMVDTRQQARATATDDADTARATALLAEEDTRDFRARWDTIQAGFVDEPRNSVEQADGLVAEVMQRLAKSFADERSTLEGQWGRGEDVDTEALRVALRRYRAFFDRLLAV
jgi:hypothetical protein